MIRTCSITSPGRTVTSPRPSSGASRRQNPGVPAPFGPNWPGPAVAAKLSMGVDARPEGPLASLGHLTKGEPCREQALVLRCSRPRTKNPHNRPFTGMPGRHPERRLPIAPGDRRSLPAPPSYTGFPAGLVWFHSGGLGSLGGACLHGRGGRIPGEGDLMLAQVPDHLLRADGGPDIGTSAGAAPCAHSGGGEKQVQGGQVRQEFVLADVDVLRPGRVYCHRAGTSVPAAVRGLAVRPGRFHPPAADTAREYPGQQVPARHRLILRHGSAGSVNVPGGDEVSVTDQRWVRGPVRGHHPSGSVAPGSRRRRWRLRRVTVARLAATGSR